MRWLLSLCLIALPYVAFADGLSNIGSPATGSPFLSQFGADKTGAVDATASLVACLNAAGLNGTCRVDPLSIIKITGTVTIPQAATLDCGGTLPDLAPPNYTAAPSIRLGANAIKFNGTGGAILNCLILPSGMTFPQSASSGWTGTAIDTQGNTAPRIENTQIIGFDKCINAYGSSRVVLKGIRCDANGGTNSATMGSIESGNDNDASVFYDIRLQVYGTAATCPARMRQGIGWYAHNATAGGVFVDAIVSQDYQTAQIKFDTYNNAVLGRVWADYASAIGCTIGTSIGMIVNNSNDVLVTQLNLNGLQTGLQATNQTSTASIYISDVFGNGIGGDLIALGGSGNGAGVVHINNLRTNSVGVIGGYAVNYLDTTGATTFQVDGGILLAVHGSAAPYINVPGTVLSYHVKLSDSIRTDLGDPSAILGTRGLGTCTGLGATGSCALLGNTRTNPFTGVVQLTVAGAGPGTTGVVPINTWPLTIPTINGCMLSPIQGNVAWPVIQDLLMQSLSGTQSQISWTTAAALVAGTYNIKFNCDLQ